MPENKAPALRKRQQIENANKTMFLWVAAAAAIVGIAGVLSVSMYERISFKQAVINEKRDTVNVLKSNNKVASDLKDEIRVLNTNKALNETPRLEDSEPISVILDALPSSANSSAFGASLQQKILRVDGITIDSLVVDPISGVEDTGESSDDSGDNTISFRFTVSAGAGQEAKLQEVLRNTERSIRGINLTSVSIEQQGQSGKISMSVEGESYYQPATVVELKETSVKKP